MPSDQIPGTASLMASSLEVYHVPVDHLVAIESHIAELTETSRIVAARIGMGADAGDFVRVLTEERDA